MEAIVTRKKDYGSYGYRYMIMKKVNDEISVIYKYRTLSKDEYDLIKNNKCATYQKPIDIAFTREKSLVKCISSLNEEVVSTNIQEHEIKLLIIPEEYKYDYDYKEIIDKNIPNEIVDEVKKVFSEKMNFPAIIVGDDFSGIKDTYGNPNIFRTVCPACHKLSVQPKQYQTICPYCNATVSQRIVSSEYKKYKETNYQSYSYSTSVRDLSQTFRKSMFYVYGVDNGIIIYKITREMSVKNNVINDKYYIDAVLEHIIGGNIQCYRQQKTKITPCDTFDFFNINSKNITFVPEVTYKDCDDFDDFALKHEKFLKMSGFQTVLKYSPERYSLEMFFIIFLCIFNMYPVMEQIVKMGQPRLFFTVYDSIKNSFSKSDIQQKVKSLSGLIDSETSKGKSALRIPVYIGEYLMKKNATLEEYFYWRDFYELTKISKENFDNFTESFNYSWINSQSDCKDIGNILKFGYSPETLYNYIMKQSKQYKIEISETVDYMSDYLTMCDMCQIEPDKYPKSIKEQHDKMTNFFKERNRKLEDAKLETISKECERYVLPNLQDKEELPVGIPKLFEEYTIIFPSSEADFINEGNQQHNCVGSYPYRVKNGYCVIFFIRKKDTPTTSFITAECTKSGLGQCYYSNNRTVYDEELIKFAKYICKKIRLGCSTDKIHALNNISN